MTPRVELEDLVTGAEIGRRLGFSTQYAHKLTVRDGFPAPLGEIGNYTVWSWKAVERWNRERPRASKGKSAG